MSTRMRKSVFTIGASLVGGMLVGGMTAIALIFLLGILQDQFAAASFAFPVAFGMGTLLGALGGLPAGLLAQAAYFRPSPDSARTRSLYSALVGAIGTLPAALAISALARWDPVAMAAAIAYALCAGFVCLLLYFRWLARREAIRDSRE